MFLAFDHFLRGLPDATSDGATWRATCPAHEGAAPGSLLFRQRGQSRTRIDLYCLAGCVPGRVFAEVTARLDEVRQ